MICDCKRLRVMLGALTAGLTAALILSLGIGIAGPRCSQADEGPVKGTKPPPFKEVVGSSGPGRGIGGKGQLSWEIPGRVSIYDLQFGAAVFEKDHWNFLGNARSFNAGLFGDRLTLMVRFSYAASQPDIPLKFVARLPNSRQFEETVHLPGRSGNYSFPITIHNPGDFLGSGSVYLYYGFSTVDVLDFTIMPGT
jgi:hypothetical protein